MPELPSTRRGTEGPPDECANRGTALKRDAKACPECGADERSGWRAESVYDGLDLPEDAFSADDEKRDRKQSQRRVNGVAWYWWCVGLVIVLVFALGVLLRF